MHNRTAMAVHFSGSHAVYMHVYWSISAQWSSEPALMHSFCFIFNSAEFFLMEEQSRTISHIKTYCIDANVVILWSIGTYCNHTLKGIFQVQYMLGSIDHHLWDDIDLPQKITLTRPPAYKNNKRKMLCLMLIDFHCNYIIYNTFFFCLFIKEFNFYLTRNIYLMLALL